jgi:hypothetical protein
MIAKVSIIMGSTSDLPIMEHAAKILDEFEIPFVFGSVKDVAFIDDDILAISTPTRIWIYNIWTEEYSWIPLPTYPLNSFGGLAIKP